MTAFNTFQNERSSILVKGGVYSIGGEYRFDGNLSLSAEFKVQNLPAAEFATSTPIESRQGFDSDVRFRR